MQPEDYNLSTLVLLVIIPYLDDHPTYQLVSNQGWQLSFLWVLPVIRRLVTMVQGAYY